MLKSLPRLDEIFEIHNCIGSGTFSSVYLSTLKSENDLAFAERQKFAIKYLLPTSHPKRIERELMCLQKAGYRIKKTIDNFCIHFINVSILQWV